MTLGPNLYLSIVLPQNMLNRFANQWFWCDSVRFFCVDSESAIETRFKAHFWKLLNLSDRQKVARTFFKNTIYYTYNPEHITFFKKCRKSILLHAILYKKIRWIQICSPFRLKSSKIICFDDFHVWLSYIFYIFHYFSEGPTMILGFPHWQQNIHKSCWYSTTASRYSMPPSGYSIKVSWYSVKASEYSTKVSWYSVQAP